MDNITGTSGNDTISGFVTSATSGTTLDATDRIAGGAGSDTLNIVVGGSATATTNGADITGVEIVNVRNVGSGDAAIDASTISGLAEVYSDRSTAKVIVRNAADGATVGVKGNGTLTNGNLDFGYKSATAAINLVIADGVTAGNITGDAVGVTDAATSATIASTGAANVVGTVNLLNGASTLTSLTINAATNLKGQIAAQTEGDFAANSTLTVKGAATSVELTGELANNIKTVDASGLTAGGLKATLGTGAEDFKGGAGVDTITLSTGVKTATFGGGNDVVTTQNGTLAATTAGAVSGGDGSDTLAVAATTDVDSSAKRAVFTSFEILQNNTTSSIAADGFTGVSSVITNGINGGFTGLSAAQAAAVTNKVDHTAVTFALTTATGTADVLSVTLNSGTSTASADLAGATVNGFETLNVTSSSGATDAGTVGSATAAANIVSFAGSGAADLTAINLAGAFGVNLILDNTSKAVTVANTLSGTADMRVEGEVIKGSSITTTANNDAIETALAAVTGVAGDFVTYNAGAGDDDISTSLTALNNTNSAQASLKIDGGAGTDTLTFTSSDATFIDSRFQFITNVEKVTLANTSSLSFTSGGFFDANFKTGGVTLTTGTTANNATQTIDLTSFTGAAKVTSTTSGDGASSADNVSITTGAGADDVTVTASSWVGAGGVAGQIAVTTGQGADKVSISVGTLLAVTGSNAVVVNTGGGADTVTLTSTNAGSDLGNVRIVIADGDSTAAARDKITGFDLGTASTISSTLDLQDTVAVVGNTTGTNGTDSGSIKSHAINNGIVTFDDIDSFTTALTIDSSNLSSVLSYLATNISTAGNAVAFAYDSDGNGSNDATIVFQQGAADTVVELVGVTATSVSTTNATTGGLLHLA